MATTMEKGDIEENVVNDKERYGLGYQNTVVSVK